MRMRKKPWAEAEIACGRHIVPKEEARGGKWRNIFGNDNPICVEIGMGKGRFIVSKALSDPCSNYIGIERHLSVFAAAAKKLREQEAGAEMNNVRITLADADNFHEMFDESEIDEIYINFCDPWPKKRYEKRRLTHGARLKQYAKALKNGGKLIFKTDNGALFEFTINELKENDWQIDGLSTDLYNDLSDPALSENIATEYEERFKALGNPIHKIVAIYKKFR